jgi:hypothetical protein
MKGFCIVCGEEIEISICCNGDECGCRGQPIEPPICSESCYDKLINNWEEYYPKKNNGSKFDLDYLFE